MLGSASKQYSVVRHWDDWHDTQISDIGRSGRRLRFKIWEGALRLVRRTGFWRRMVLEIHGFGRGIRRLSVPEVLGVILAWWWFEIHGERGICL